MDNSTCPVTIPGNIDRISGPLLLGYVFNWGLFGILSVQVYLYYVSFPRDRIASKCLVFGVFIFETVQTILVTNDAWLTLGSGWGQASELMNPHTSCINVPVMSSITSCVVQLFNAWRIFILSQSYIVSAIVAMLAIVEMIAGIVVGVQCVRINNLSLLQSEAFKSDAVWLSTSASCDVIIALSMSYYLWRSNTGFRRTRVLLSRLIRLVIGAGLLTAAVALVDMTLFLVYKKTGYHTTPAIIIPKLYSNSLLVQFNSRLRIVGERDEDNSNFIHNRSTIIDSDLMVHPSSKSRRTRRVVSKGFRSPTSNRSNDLARFPMDGINVSITTHQETDGDSIPLETKNPSLPSQGRVAFDVLDSGSGRNSEHNEDTNNSEHLDHKTHII